MPEHLPTYQLPPDKLTCPRCEARFEGASPITPGKPRGFQKGMLTVCGHCGGAIIMGDANFQPLHPAEIKKLPVETQKQLELVQAMITRQVKKRDSTDQV